MIAPTLEEGLLLRLTGEIVSRPYIDMTLHIMRAFGAQAKWEAEDCLKVQPGVYRPIPYYIESDWSAASYWYEMVALSGDDRACVELPALYSPSLQGDSAVQHMFAQLGVSTTFFTNGEGVESVRLEKRNHRAERMDWDFTNQPDLAQTLVATCIGLGVPFRFTGLQSLRIKETDRMAALRSELDKLGYRIEEVDGSVLSWDGKRQTVDCPAALDTYEDHRMAMALAPLALKLGALEMNDPEVVSKSYPNYWHDLRAMGFNIGEA